MLTWFKRSVDNEFTGGRDRRTRKGTRNVAHEMRLAVRGYELDSFGHVNNAVYLNYMEQARWEILNELGLYGRLFGSGFVLAVTEATIRYSREAKVYDELVIRTEMKHRPPYLLFTHVINRADNGDLVARGTIKTILVDGDRIPHDIPESLIPGENDN